MSVFRLGPDHLQDLLLHPSRASWRALRFSRDTEVVIVGGGNSAGQAAVFLSGYARHLHVVVRGESLAATMSSYLVDRIEASDRITVHSWTQVTALHGGDALEGVTLARKGL